MAVRGAPAIGVAAAYGAAFSMRSGATTPPAERFETARHLLAATRPTAVNLFAALERMARRFQGVAASAPEEIETALLAEADAIAAEDIEACRRIGRYGAELLSAGTLVMTHCNAGALATAGYGTALGVIRGAVEAGKAIRVLACETRPYLQGARLTAWELAAGSESPWRSSRTAWAATSSPAAKSRPSSSAPTASPPTATRPTRSGRTRSRSWPRRTASLLRRRADDDDRPRLPRRLRDSDRGARLRRSPLLRRPFDRPGGRRRAVRRLRRHARPLHHRHRDGPGDLPGALSESLAASRVRLEEQFVIGDW